MEAGYVKKSSKEKIFHMLSHILLQAFTLTFVAEWGDRSQISTMAIAVNDVSFYVSNRNPGNLIFNSVIREKF